MTLALSVCQVVPLKWKIIRKKYKLFINVANQSKIDIQSGGYICVTSNSNINLVNVDSYLNLFEGSILGTNPILNLSTSCLGSVSSIPKTGLGSINNFNEDVYIQNETISSDRYITGRNIYIGYDVTTTKPYGNVLINGNCTVNCKAAHDVIVTKGFDCVTGSIFEIQK